MVLLQTGKLVEMKEDMLSFMEHGCIIPFTEMVALQTY